jgi:hypothetical protein
MCSRDNYGKQCKQQTALLPTEQGSLLKINITDWYTKCISQYPDTEFYSAKELIPVCIHTHNTSFLNKDMVLWLMTLDSHH